jgi:hypothetical protein
MNNTVARFERGIHAKDDCGKNKHGYAATSVLFRSADVHRLGRVFTSSSKLAPLHTKKKAFGYSDILVYIFMKVLFYKGTDNTYILFLSSGSFLSSTIKNIISSLSQASTIVIVVQQMGSGFDVTVNFSKTQSSCVCVDGPQLLEFFTSVCDTQNTFAIIHPVVNPVYKELVSQCGIRQWCVPSSRSEIYVSKSSDGSHFHNVFPWSKRPCYSGFTIGIGPMELGSAVERNKYIGSFNSYEALMSCVPIEDSCTDCVALKRIAKFVRILTGETVVKHRHKISESSVEALEAIKEMARVLLK